jgi:hypothetical protein
MATSAEVAAGANSAATMNSLFKVVYADKMAQVIPDGKKLTTMIPFLPREKNPGLVYQQPVILGLEHGITFASEDDGAFELNAPVAGQIKTASIKGFQMVLRSALPVSQVSRSLGGGNKAFEDATKFLVGNMLESITKKLEIEMLYGQMGYAKIASSTNVDSTHTALTIKASEFAPGIWAGAEGMKLDLYNGSSLLATVSVSKVSLETKKVTVVGSAADITALDIAIAANPNVLDIFHNGAKGKEFAGIHKILTNTGDLFGIDASQYNMWKGSEYDAEDTVLTIATVQEAIAKGVEKGLDQDVTVFVNPSHWDDLMTEQAALRMYDSSYKSSEAENGAKSIKFYSQNGMVAIVPSIYVKEGYAYAICVEDFARVGSTDVTFKIPGSQDQFFRQLENHMGFELRAYTDQALFCNKPGRSVIIKGVKAA